MWYKSTDIKRNEKKKINCYEGWDKETKLYWEGRDIKSTDIKRDEV